MNISFAGRQTMFGGTFLKSTQQRMERQQKADSQIEYWEGRKQSLKSMKCETVEEIARKLDMLHAYEDEIAAAKMAYNQEQMFHVLDEAREQGEKIAEANEKTKPKTAEERREDIIEEALGIEESEGMLEEVMEAMEELVEEVLEETVEDMTEAVEDVTQDSVKDVMEENVEDVTQDFMKDVTEETVEDVTQDFMKDMTEETVEDVSQKSMESIVEETMEDVSQGTMEGMMVEEAAETTGGMQKPADNPREMIEQNQIPYRPLDIRI